MQKSYNKSFQGLRWLAAVMVFICHTDYLYNAGHQELLDGLGPFAVVIFFTLSGFLAQKNYEERSIDANGNVSLSRQCFNSFIKAVKAYFPIHLFTLLISAVIRYNSFIVTPGKTIIIFILNLLLLHSWAPQTYGSFNSISWYVSIMLFVMTISPVLVRLIKRIRWELSFIILILINAVQFLLAILLNDWSYGFYFIYIFPPVRVLNYVAGCLLFRIIEKIGAELKSFVSEILLIISFLLGGILIWLYIGQTQLMYLSAIWSVPSWGIIFALARGNDNSKVIKAIFANRLAVFLGGITFEFFMIHMLVITIGRKGFNYFGWGAPLLLYIIAFAVSLIGAIALHYLTVYFKARQAMKPKKGSTK